MGDNYSTNLRVKFRRNGEKRAIRALQDLIRRADETNTNYSLDKYESEGITPDTFDNLMRIFFAGWKYQRVTIGEWKNVGGKSRLIRRDAHGFVKYSNSFSCSYGWQGVMWRMFDEIAPFCADGTELGIDTDDGYVRKEITDGEAEIVEDVDYRDC